MTATTTTNHGDYGLWLLATDDGAIELTGWVEATSHADPDATSPNTEYWPDYAICQDRRQLPARLEELGLQLAAGSLLSDLDKGWHVYVKHPDLTALRAQLDNDRARQRG